MTRRGIIGGAYVTDKNIGNTGGLGGVFGIFYAIGYGRGLLHRSVLGTGGPLTRVRFSLLAKRFAHDFEISKLTRFPMEWFPSDQTRAHTWYS